MHKTTRHTCNIKKVAQQRDHEERNLIYTKEKMYSTFTVACENSRFRTGYIYSLTHQKSYFPPLLVLFLENWVFLSNFIMNINNNIVDCLKKMLILHLLTFHVFGWCNNKHVLRWPCASKKSIFPARVMFNIWEYNWTPFKIRDTSVFQNILSNFPCHEKLHTSILATVHFLKQVKT